MPNHIHGIVFLSDVGARHAAPSVHGRRFGDPLAGSLATILGSFKSAATKRINDLRKTPGSPVWQRNYYEHVIRDDESLRCFRKYIAHDPQRWEFDRENPNATNPEARDVWFGDS